MKKLDREAFTLVELLAALVILGLLMAVAAPNVMGILNRSKNEMYIEDAKKLVARAEYVMRSDTSIQKPKNITTPVFFSLGYLDNSRFDEAPNGGEYFINRSYVKVTKENNQYVYRVQLLECGKDDIQKNTDGSKRCKKDNGYKGIRLMESSQTSEDLYKDNAVKDLVKAGDNRFTPVPITPTNTYCDETNCGIANDLIKND